MGCTFEDHPGGYLYVVHQVALNKVETIRVKNTFGREAHKYGVV